MSGDIYEWAVSKEVGFNEETSLALQALEDYLAGKHISSVYRKRWRAVGVIDKHGKVHLSKEEERVDGLAWAMLGLVYEGFVKRVPADSKGKNGKGAR